MSLVTGSSCGSPVCDIVIGTVDIDVVLDKVELVERLLIDVLLLDPEEFPNLEQTVWNFCKSPSELLIEHGVNKGFILDLIEQILPFTEFFYTWTD